MLPTLPLTHIAAVSSLRTGWKVHAIYRRGRVPAKRTGSFWIFVPATVKVGDEVLSDPGVTTYADPEWAEWWAAGGKGPTPKVRR